MPRGELRSLARVSCIYLINMWELYIRSCKDWPHPDGGWFLPLFIWVLYLANFGALAGALRDPSGWLQKVHFLIQTQLLVCNFGTALSFWLSTEEQDEGASIRTVFQFQAH